MGHIHRLIAFDLDGTLIDSRRDLADSANELIAELGGTPLTEDAVTRMVGGGAARLVRRALEASGVPHPPDAVARFLAIYDTRLLKHTRPYPGIDETLRLARTLGRVALLTNKPHAPSLRIVEQLGWRDLFDEVIGGDGPHPRKPDPASLQALMASAAASPGKTLMVGDSVIDLDTAIAAGTRCCLVSYGFGFETFPQERVSSVDWLAPDTRAVSVALTEFAR